MQNYLSDYTSVVPLIERQFPGFIRTQSSSAGDKAMAVLFMEAYYEWLEQQGNAKARIDEFKNIMDINYSVGEFFSHLRKTYLDPVPSSIASDPALLIKHIRQFYKSRGSVKSIVFLFKILYNADIYITYKASRRLPGDPIDFGDEVWQLTTNFLLGTATLNASGGFAAENILFLDYQSIHNALAHKLGENFRLGSSTLVSQAYIQAATDQGYDPDTFDGTVLVVVPENFTYIINTTLNGNLFRQNLLDMAHPAGMEYEVQRPAYTTDSVTVTTDSTTILIDSPST